MKRIIAIISAVAALCSLASCAVTSNMTPEEQLSYHHAKEQEAIEESMRIEEEIVEEIERVTDKIGKTEKNKKIVLEKYTETVTTKRVLYMDRKGKCEYSMTYEFYKTKDDYEFYLNAGDCGKYKLVDHDDKNRLLVYKNVEFLSVGQDFDVLYEGHKGATLNGFTLVE